MRTVVSPTLSSICHSMNLVLSLVQEIGELLVGDSLSALVVPEVGSVVRVGLTEGSNGGLDGVTQSTGVTTRAGVHVINSSKSEELLHHGRSNNTSSTRSGDQAHTDGTALASHLNGDGVDLTLVGTPIATAHGNDGHLGNQDGSLDGSGHFLGALGTKTDMTVAVTDSDEGLEAGSLSGSGLLLDGEHLHNLLLKIGKQLVDNLGFLDGQGEQVDLLDGGDLTGLHQTTKLGHGHPFALLLSVAARAALLTATATRALLLHRSLSGNFSRNFSRNYK